MSSGAHFHPQTPQSPCQPSPSNAELSSSSMNSASGSHLGGTLPTPAHSVNGSSGPDGSQDLAMPDDSLHKRKRSLDDTGDRQPKKTHLDDPERLEIDRLHIDVGPKHLLCRTPHPQPKHPVTEDLFDKFGLTGLAAEVARTLPSGEKNAMRKTYKGYIKKLGVSGHFDPIKKDALDPDGFQYMVLAPQPDWEVHEVQGKDISAGFSTLTQRNLAAAMSMAKGPIGKDRWDSSILGDIISDKAGKPKPSAASTPTPGGQGGGAGAGSPAMSAGGANSALSRAKTSQPSPASNRSPAHSHKPRRSIMKRGYGDSSFEGYSEGYDSVDTGDSAAEGDFAAQKRRKKNPQGGHFSGHVRSGMVGA